MTWTFRDTTRVLGKLTKRIGGNTNKRNGFMKFLDCPELYVATQALDHCVVNTQVITGKVEVYSCKSAGTDKKLRQKIERRCKTEKSFAEFRVDSPLGPMTDPLRRKLLFFLIGTLNSVFIHEHDFSMTYPDDFERVPSMVEVLRNVKTYFTSILQKKRSLLVNLWREIDKTISLNDCEIYTFVPDADSTDPLSQGLWSFNYLFFNRKLKRIACFTCISKSVCDSSGEESDEGFASDVSY